MALGSRRRRPARTMPARRGVAFLKQLAEPEHRVGLAGGGGSLVPVPRGLRVCVLEQLGEEEHCVPTPARVRWQRL